MSDLIFLEQAPSQGTEHSPDEVSSVGREGCDVNIDDSEVSRRHAAIRREGDAVVIEDLGSTNGTFVNGERISGSQSLSEGDEVRFGATVWRLQARSQRTAAARQVVGDPQVTAARDVTRPREQPAGAPPAHRGTARRGRCQRRRACAKLRPLGHPAGGAAIGWPGAVQPAESRRRRQGLRRQAPGSDRLRDDHRGPDHRRRGALLRDRAVQVGTVRARGAT